MNQIEEIVTKRRLHQRLVNIEELKEVVDPKKTYNYKANLVDNKISQEFDYFATKKLKSVEIIKIDKKFRAISRVLQQREAA